MITNNRYSHNDSEKDMLSKIVNETCRVFNVTIDDPVRQNDSVRAVLRKWLTALGEVLDGQEEDVPDMFTESLLIWLESSDWAGLNTDWYSGASPDAIWYDHRLNGFAMVDYLATKEGSYIKMSVPSGDADYGQSWWTEEPVSPPPVSFGTNNITLSAWVNFTSLSATESLLFCFKGTAEDNDGNGIKLSFKNDSIIAYIGDENDNAALLITSMTVPVGEWHLWTVTLNRDASTITLFLDGVEVDSGATDVMDAEVVMATTSTLGTNRSGGPFVFPLDALLGQVLMYETLLTDLQISNNFEATKSSYGY